MVDITQCPPEEPAEECKIQFMDDYDWNELKVPIDLKEKMDEVEEIKNF